MRRLSGVGQLRISCKICASLISGTRANRTVRSMSSSGGRSSRISGFHNLGVEERIDKLASAGFLSQESVQAIRGAGLQLQDAKNMVENVISTFGLPMGVALNMLVNNREYAVPMVVEEPSVVAAVSNVARLARPAGFTATSDPPVMIGQIHILNVSPIFCPRHFRHDSAV